MTDAALQPYEATVLTALVIAYAVTMLLRWLRRSRATLAVGIPVGIAVLVRIAAAGAVSLTSSASSLRGPDEALFIAEARDIAHVGLFSHTSLSTFPGSLHIWLFAVQHKLLHSPDFALRITQVGLAVIGMTLVVAAVFDLAGPRASTTAAWLLAFEPTSIFFGGLLHKEALLFLAEGLVVFGAATAWRRGPGRGLAAVALGCAIAIETRAYVGWFLVAASAVVMLHSALRREHRSSLRSLTIILTLAALAVPAVPVLLRLSSKKSLAALQISQQANATDNSNLKLDKIDFSSRGKIIINLPRRVFDVVFRPFPWQLGDTSQRIALIGTLVVLATLIALVASVRNRRRIFARAGPLIYVAGFELIAYSLASGNAGTAFRYRSHVEVLALAIAVILRSRRPIAVPTATPRTPGEPRLATAAA